MIDSGALPPLRSMIAIADSEGSSSPACRAGRVIKSMAVHGGEANDKRLVKCGLVSYVLSLLAHRSKAVRTSAERILAWLSVTRHGSAAGANATDHCAVCEKIGGKDCVKMYHCTACRHPDVRYCSVACQTRRRPDHRSYCRKGVAKEEIAAAEMEAAAVAAPRAIDDSPSFLS